MVGDDVLQDGHVVGVGQGTGVPGQVAVGDHHGPLAAVHGHPCHRLLDGGAGDRFGVIFALDGVGNPVFFGHQVHPHIPGLPGLGDLLVAVLIQVLGHVTLVPSPVHLPPGELHADGLARQVQEPTPQPGHQPEGCAENLPHRFHPSKSRPTSAGSAAIQSALASSSSSRVP